MGETRCRAGGCSNPIPEHLADQALCLDHYLVEAEVRITACKRQLAEGSLDDAARDAALQFVLLTAARIATVGVQSPPDDQILRGRMLHTMLMLADLRERLDKKEEVPGGKR
ncbi:MAG TPA: hypothetical protein VNN18_06115 [Candidatus Xenobia bacterium]|nr:hypothetical protein [Candidatus Xenobia bacterium]